MHIIVVQKYYGSYEGRGNEDRWQTWGFRVGKSMEAVATELHLTLAEDWPKHWNEIDTLKHYKDSNHRYYRLQSVEEFNLAYWPFG